jgi:hypothetical protein
MEEFIMELDKKEEDLEEEKLELQEQADQDILQCELEIKKIQHKIKKIRKDLKESLKLKDCEISDNAIIKSLHKNSFKGADEAKKAPI